MEQRKKVGLHFTTKRDLGFVSFFLVQCIHLCSARKMWKGIMTIFFSKEEMDLTCLGFFGACINPLQCASFLLLFVTYCFPVNKSEVNRCNMEKRPNKQAQIIQQGHNKKFKVEIWTEGYFFHWIYGHNETQNRISIKSNYWRWLL